MNTRHKLTSKLLREKVVTESDFMRIASLGTINSWYKQMIALGYPLRRRTLEQKWTRDHRPLAKHRTVIYYME